MKGSAVFLPKWSWFCSLGYGKMLFACMCCVNALNNLLLLFVKLEETAEET